MVQANQLYNINFYQKAIFYGSDRGMNYKIEKADRTDGEPVFLVTVWPGPYNFATTPDDKKTTREFPFSNEALSDIADYLNQTHRENFE